eukprot:77760-Amphidinium_carterae.3
MSVTLSEDVFNKLSQVYAVQQQMVSEDWGIEEVKLQPPPAAAGAAAAEPTAGEELAAAEPTGGRGAPMVPMNHLQRCRGWSRAELIPESMIDGSGGHDTIDLTSSAWMHGHAFPEGSRSMIGIGPMKNVRAKA